MMQIPLYNGGFTLVDDDDYPFLSQWKWKRHPQGYASRTSWKHFPEYYIFGIGKATIILVIVGTVAMQITLWACWWWFT